MSEMPEELRELERKLQAVHFRPRESFEPELLTRVQRGDVPAASPSQWSRRHLVRAAVAVLAGLTGISAAYISGGRVISVDRCCYDLDGGGTADDGVVVTAERDSKVHRLRVYEDRDGSASYTRHDLVRLDRGEKPAILGSQVDGIITTRRCCVDLDGGGIEDDGLLVIGTPPDRVFMAAIYETGLETNSAESKDGWLLR